jgi:hypothetical protein
VTDHDRVVAINFCGGCKPMIDRRSIALEIEEALAARGIALVFNDWDAPFIVRLSGCTASCAARYHPCDRPGPVIAGPSFDVFPVGEAELAERAIAAIDAFHGAQPPPAASVRRNPAHVEAHAPLAPPPSRDDRRGPEE